LLRDDPQGLGKSGFDAEPGRIEQRGVGRRPQRLSKESLACTRSAGRPT